MSFTKLALFFLGIAGILALTQLLGAEQVHNALAQITPKALVTLFLLQLGTLVASAWIWHFLLSRHSRITLGRVFLINQAASLLESLTPSVKFGSEAAKVYLFRQQTGQTYQDLTGTLMVQKFITLAPFVLLCLLVFIPALHFFDLPLSFHVSLMALSILAAALGWLCYAGPSQVSSSSPPEAPKPQRSRLIIVPLEKMQTGIQKTIDFLQQARCFASALLSPRQTSGLLGVSFLVWFFYPVKVYLVCLFLGLDVHPLIIALATLFAYMISMVPLLPGGLGTYEGGMAAFFTLGGLSPSEGLAIALVSRLTTFWFPLVLSAIACLVLSRGNRLVPEPPGIRHS